MEGLKPVDGFERYFVNKDGQVFRYLTVSDTYKRLRPFTRSNRGYQTLTLRREKRQRTTYVHRIVAKAFVPNPKNKPEINHKDGDKTNNVASNLEWVTREENMFHSLVFGFRQTGASHPLAKLSKTDVWAILNKKEQGKSSYALAKEFQVSQSVIMGVWAGRTYWKEVMEYDGKTAR